ncbi:MAG: hypothetical protein MI807_09960, partial [Verrucomicrobiales bacterium]|nr:hypothetical protein [Verrucomicrobiales bacterium]
WRSQKHAGGRDEGRVQEAGLGVRGGGGVGSLARSGRCTVCPVFADILKRLGRERAWAVHGSAGEAGGMDELSTIGDTTLFDTAPNPVSSPVQPGSLGIKPAEISELQGGEATENGEIITAILEGNDKGPKRDIVMLNCAAGLVITGLEPDLQAGLARANEVIDSGAALEVLRKWQNFS